MNPFVLTVATGSFEAARSVSLLPKGHRCRNLHGHGFEASVFAELKPGWAAFPGGEVASLTKRLEEVLAPLNYVNLNDVMEHPTDENISRWIRKAMNVPGIDRVAVKSTPNQGVDLDRDGIAHVWRRYKFQAAHKLPNVPAGHKCGRMHGHGFEVIVHANQNLGFQPLGIDYDHLDKLWAPLHFELNYRCLNDIEGLSNPTSELISSWLWHRLKPQLPGLSGITVFETGSCGARFDGATYRIWKDFTLDSAVRLKRAPIDAPQARLHGHTFQLRLQLVAPIDAVRGWTVDFGDVKDVFNPFFKELDHHPLHERSELNDSDAVSIATWIYTRAKEVLPQLSRVDLWEEKGCGAAVTACVDEPVAAI